MSHQPLFWMFGSDPDRARREDEERRRYLPLDDFRLQYASCPATPVEGPPYPGDDKTIESCRARFDNFQPFGGFPELPPIVDGPAEVTRLWINDVEVPLHEGHAVLVDIDDGPEDTRL